MVPAPALAPAQLPTGPNALRTRSAASSRVVLPRRILTGRVSIWTCLRLRSQPRDAIAFQTTRLTWLDLLVHETYITHIRINEYSSHPTSPAPPQARTPESTKPRVIIVAVRKSGRVRVHKSKENVNGTFSIGKTWNLDDLSHIESYTGSQVNPTLREWAGDTGFLVTLGKSYFWQAQTDKEKKFFIASLIKIYGKYTGGKVPELQGFEPRELDQVLGAGRRQAGPPPPPPASV